ncbi:zinc finger protein with KRAB and SCAN domains 3-like [Labrus bergylta]|uniref:zinc finger protein with KRAB and SCAN domains 3-like n=1 Tax=Labrus bergylta TaxID=56723 RepID=UPI003313285E
MSKVRMLRSFVNQRLTAAAEEIFDLFERTIAEYEEQLNLLDSCQKHDVRLHVSDVQQLMVRKEEVHPEQQESSSRLDQEDPPEPPHIKEDREELWSSQEGEQLQGPEEADTSMVTFFRVPVKTEEDDGETPRTSQLNENKPEESGDVKDLNTEADGEDCGGSEPDRDFNPDSHLQTVSLEDTSLLTGSDTDESGDWEERYEPQEGLNPLQKKVISISDMNCNTGNTSVSSSGCATSFAQMKPLQKHKTIHTGEKPFSCSVCGKRFTQSGSLKMHSFVHTGEKPFSCSVCGKHFIKDGDLKRHSVVHTGEKPFSCSVCGKRFTQSGSLKMHSLIHTGVRPFSCNFCDRTFTRKHSVKYHKCRSKMA